jgi:hypothetical protein
MIQIDLKEVSKLLNGEENSTFSFEDAMSLIDADAVLVEA